MKTPDVPTPHGGRRVGRPTIYKSRDRLTVVLEASLARWVAAEAKRRKTSRSRVVAAAIERERECKL